MAKSNVAPALEDLLVAIETLHPDPKNARVHDDRNLQAIRDSYERFGQQKPIVIASDGQVIAGNGQLAAAADPPQADSRTDRMHDCMKKGS